jgi:hypothetical protein
MKWKTLFAFALAVFVPTAMVSGEPLSQRTQLPLPFGTPRMVPGSSARRSTEKY